MSEPALTFGIWFILMGLLVWGLSVPLVQGRIRPNAWYGIRITAAGESEEAWYRINRHGGKCFVAYGAAHVVIGGLGLLLPNEIPSVLTFILSILPLILLIPAVICVFRYPRNPQ